MPTCKPRGWIGFTARANLKSSQESIEGRPRGSIHIELGIEYSVIGGSLGGNQVLALLDRAKRISQSHSAWK